MQLAFMALAHNKIKIIFKFYIFWITYFSNYSINIDNKLIKACNKFLFLFILYFFLLPFFYFFL